VYTAVFFVLTHDKPITMFEFLSIVSRSTPL